MCAARQLSLISLGLLVGCATDLDSLGGSSGALAGDPSLPVEARLLVLSADGSETELTAIRTVLDYRGVPYDVFVAAAEPALTASRLGSADHGAYQGIILTSASIDAVLSSSERTVLADYESTFAIRRAVLAARPDPALGDLALAVR
ncbi:MAG: hypothetical protein K8M05_09570 [Deltaproteobacteria bacterium]|nr:hypothetical protein [Kofleriaceae bacterium]